MTVKWHLEKDKMLCINVHSSQSTGSYCQKASVALLVRSLRCLSAFKGKQTREINTNLTAFSCIWFGLDIATNLARQMDWNPWNSPIWPTSKSWPSASLCRDKGGLDRESDNRPNYLPSMWLASCFLKGPPIFPIIFKTRFFRLTWRKNSRFGKTFNLEFG